jgi:acyl-CoA thioesterase
MVANNKVQTAATANAPFNKPILVVTSHFIEPIETRIDNKYEVRRNADGKLFSRYELLAAPEGADAP